MTAENAAIRHALYHVCCELAHKIRSHESYADVANVKCLIGSMLEELEDYLIYFRNIVEPGGCLMTQDEVQWTRNIKSKIFNWNLAQLGNDDFLAYLKSEECTSFADLVNNCRVVLFANGCGLPGYLTP